MGTTAALRWRESIDDALTSYLEEIRAYPLLTREQETELARRVKAGDTKALERLVCSNLRFVVSIAKRYQEHGVPLSDLINEGNLGLIHAAERFDEAKGVKLITYAVWWIRQALVQAIADHGHAVRVPAARAGTLRRISRHANTLRHELGREPTREELIEGMTQSDVDIAELPISRSYLSLDAPLGETADDALIGYLADDVSATPDHEVAERNLTESVGTALGHLRPREARVIRLYFGFDGKEPMTLEAIGELLGITRERVRQIKAKALARLRRSSSAAALASLHDR